MKHIRRLLVIIFVVALFFAYKNYNLSKLESKKYINKEIKRQDNILVLVNKEYSLPKDYEPYDLVKPDVRFSPDTSGEEELMERKAAEALEKLFEGADKNGIRFYGVSGYRSYSLQNSIYKKKIKSVGKETADKYVAEPGHSEHQTGLAMDLTNEDGANKELSGDFGKTNEGIWLKNNAYKYGFIIRYPRGKEDITGYNYEPWHIRYVGEDAAKKIKNGNLVFEEYLKGYDSALAGGEM